jgi:uncharacterized membrane protein (UPF0127 family)
VRPGRLDRDGITLFPAVEVLDGTLERMKGLLGRASLPDGAAVLIRRCSSVHTFFMQFSIDLVFLDATGVVVRVVPAVRPFRMAWGGARARSVVEARAGAIAERGLACGDCLRLVER